MDVCSNGCGYLAISYNCRNRHCPKCQSLQQAKWLEARPERLLPTRYFHLVVTLPHELNPVTLLNRNSSSISSLRPPPGPCSNLLGTTSACELRSVLLPYCTPGIKELNSHNHLHLVVTGGGSVKMAKGGLPPATFSSSLSGRSRRSSGLKFFMEGLEKAFREGD